LVISSLLDLFLSEFTPILTWLVYLLECADGSYYAGITNRLEHRLEAHNSGDGARYTRARRPVILLATQEHPDRSEASKAEARLKKLPRAEKLGFFKTSSSAKYL
jgi:putative endonuclease